MSEKAQQLVLARSAQTASDGGTERYKVSHHLHGTIREPQILTQT
jgi:hypothetical protein